MNKAHVLSEIRRIAKERGGTAPGLRTFESETGIRRHQVVGVLWRQWSDAISEAGLAPNRLQTGYDIKDLLDKYAKLACELKRLPTKDDLLLKHSNDPEFPSVHAYRRHFAGKSGLAQCLAAHCMDRPGNEDVALLCKKYLAEEKTQQVEAPVDKTGDGFVYLVKSGRYYKIGRTNAAGRREYELALQLPEKPRTVHVITTDDPAGIESYWHRRFGDKRKNGEWFELAPQDVTAFRRRKFM